MCEYESYYEEKINRLFDYLNGLNLKNKELIKDIEDKIIIESITNEKDIDNYIKYKTKYNSRVKNENTN